MTIKYSDEFKLKVVRDFIDRPAGITLEDKVKKYGVSSNSISKWNKLYKEGKLAYSASTSDNSNPAAAKRKLRSKKPIRHSRGHNACINELENEKTENKKLKEMVDRLTKEVDELKQGLGEKDLVIKNLASIITGDPKY